MEPAASLLTGLLMLFILPGAVNMMNSFHKFTGVIPQVVLIAVLSALLSLLSAAGTAQALARLLSRKKEADRHEPA